MAQCKKGGWPQAAQSAAVGGRAADALRGIVERRVSSRPLHTRCSTAITSCAMGSDQHPGRLWCPAMKCSVGQSKAPQARRQGGPMSAVRRGPRAAGRSAAPYLFRASHIGACGKRAARLLHQLPKPKDKWAARRAQLSGGNARAGNPCAGVRARCLEVPQTHQSTPTLNSLHPCLAPSLAQEPSGGPLLASQILHAAAPCSSCSGSMALSARLVLLALALATMGGAQGRSLMACNPAACKSQVGGWIGGAAERQ